MTNNKKGGYKVGTVISGAQSVENNVVPVVSSGKNQSVNGQKFGDIMAKSVGGNAGKEQFFYRYIIAEFNQDEYFII